jgi:hypothetical protein
MKRKVDNSFFGGKMEMPVIFSYHCTVPKGHLQRVLSSESDLSLRPWIEEEDALAGFDVHEKLCSCED